MKGKPIIILAVGKLKAEYWKAAFIHYRKMLEQWRALKIIELKDSQTEKAISRRKELEGEKILSALPANTINVTLSENGQAFSSIELAELLKKWQYESDRKPCFIIGGPFGLHEKVIGVCEYSISLSKMTWPHELARVLLVEQLYRAHTILAHKIYHY